MHLKWENRGMKTPLARARGLGSAKEGVNHWMNQKITAVASIPLMLWLVFSVISQRGASYAEFTAWLGQPVNAILMILVIISTFYHAMLGTQVVAEDYIHSEGRKIFYLILFKLFFIGTGIACIFSILKIAL